jgi:hypothetical protein
MAPSPDTCTHRRIGGASTRSTLLLSFETPTTRSVGMVALRAYLVLAVVLLLVKTVELAVGH